MGSIGAAQKTFTFLVAVVVPIFFVRFTSDPFNLPKLVLLMVSIPAIWTLVFLGWVKGKRTQHVRHIPVVPIVAVTLPLAASWLMNPDRWWGLLGSFSRYQGLIPYLLLISLSALVVVVFFEEPLVPLRALGLSGVVVGAYACLQWAGLDPFVWAIGGALSLQITAGLGNANFVGGFLAMTLPVAIVMYWQRPRGSYVGAVAVIVLGLVATRSQGAWVAAVAGVAPVVLFLWGEPPKEPRKRFVAATTVVAMIAIIAIGSVIYSAAAPRGAPFTSPTARYRADWWGSAIDMGVTRPLAGHGPNAFAVEGIQFRSQQDAVERPFDFTDDPHSIPLSWLANWGLFGFVGYLIFAGWIFRKGSEAFMKDSWVAVTYFAVLAAYLAQGLLSIDELSLRMAAWIGVGGLAIAVESESAGDRKRKKREKRKVTEARNKRWIVPLAAMLCVLVASAFSAGRLVVADSRAAAASKSFSNEEYDDFVRLSERAVNLWDNPHYRHQFGFRLGMAAVDGEISDRFLDDARRYFSYLNEFPDVPALRDLGHILFLGSRLLDSGDPALLGESVAVYQRAHALDPQNPILRAELAEVLIALEREEEALGLLAPYSQVVGYTNAPFWASLALAFDANGLKEESDSALVQAHRLDEEDPLVERVTEELSQTSS